MTQDAKQRVGGYAAYYDPERSAERAALLCAAEAATLGLRRAQAALPTALEAAYMAGNTERDLARATGISQSRVHRLIAHRRARRWRDALTDFAEYLSGTPAASATPFSRMAGTAMMGAWNNVRTSVSFTGRSCAAPKGFVSALPSR